MKIVIIGYSIYPINAPRAHRSTELAKEFGKQGHDVTLYALTGKYDYSQFEKAYNIKVKNLGKHWFSRFSSDNIYKKPDYICTRVVRKLIGRYLEFPDIDLARLTYKTLKKEYNIDLLITVAIPFPIHWGAALFKSLYKNKMKNTTWIADCGDPFMGNPFHKHPFYFKYIERWFCRKTDYLSIPIEEAKDAYYPEFRHKLKVIPQGFNFDSIKIAETSVRNEVPTFIYAGVFYAGIRDPRPLLDYLIKKQHDFKFIVFTKTKDILNEYKDEINKRLFIHDYIPREQLIKEMSSADFLLNLENNTTLQSPSKLIDYRLSKRPILSINSSKELDIEKIEQFLSGDYSQATLIDNIERYNIKNVVNEFITLTKE